MFRIQDVSISGAVLTFIKDSTIYTHKITFPSEMKNAVLKVNLFSIFNLFASFSISILIRLPFFSLLKLADPEKSPQSKATTNNKINPHMTLNTWFEPGRH